MSSSKSANRKLAIYLHDLLDIPLDRHGDPVVGYKILSAIGSSMRDALKRGEDIHVKGFGIFRVVERTARRTGSNFITQSGVKSPTTLSYRTKRVVTFQPAEQLKAMLNLGTTWDENRAMELWNDE